MEGGVGVIFFLSIKKGRLFFCLFFSDFCGLCVNERFRLEGLRLRVSLALRGRILESALRYVVFRDT